MVNPGASWATWDYVFALLTSNYNPRWLAAGASLESLFPSSSVLVRGFPVFYTSEMKSDAFSS